MNTTLDITLFESPNVLVAFKTLIKNKEIELREKFNPKLSVLKLLHEKSDFIDSVLSVCFQHF